jgi:2-oxoglutarate dehydrogenase E2 component (dihydrolipoamide succinyltransferase)
MPTELKVPAVGESITEVVLSKWLVQPGQRAKKDEPLVVIETDKVTVELPASADGVLVSVLKSDGSKAAVGEVIGVFEEGASGAAPAAKPAAKKESATPAVMPSAARVIAQQALGEVAGSGPGGRVLKEDAARAAAAKATAPAPAATPAATPAAAATGPRHEEVVPMTPLRKRIAERLVHAQSTAAMLTTFNEIDMSAVIELRKTRNDDFQKRHGVKLGFMSFFVKAAVDALALVPQVNAEVRGDAIVYKDYFDIGVAVGGGKGLLVPILRNAEALSFAEIEKQIADLGRRAQDNKISLDELTGGTFTISNGGIYGSMMSTPILNPPQSGILGLHAITERAVVRDGQIVARPMMYVALTYDHRIVDGREAVTFLKRIKDCIEDPTRMLLEV